MNKKILAISILAVTSLVGCSTIPSVTGKGEYYTPNKSMSYARNIAAYAGYPELIKDNEYSHGLDALVTTGSNVAVLSSDLGSAVGGGLGLGLGLMSSLTALYPLNLSDVWNAQLNPGEKYDDAATAARVLKANYKVIDASRFSPKSHASYDKAFMVKGSLNDVVCENTMLVGFDYVCADPAFPDNEIYVAAIRPANGTEFADILGAKPGNYGVYLIDVPNTVEVTEGSTDSLFKLQNGAYVSGDGTKIFPRVAPREDGKRLVFINGQATFI
ncbi:hypothetical protein ACTG2K_10320 [Aeromonas caviae]|uniref:Lipoprotein n=1 Tax=Aeromonas caviae TaxID=648 RepID=A0A6S4T687_AERCA|nr:hypothetical protein [Aeromonas caviae]BBQ30640.1 hypothetical protein WP2W18E01_22220 [Aeromonas caviae]